MCAFKFNFFQIYNSVQLQSNVLRTVKTFRMLLLSAQFLCPFSIRSKWIICLRLPNGTRILYIVCVCTARARIDNNNCYNARKDMREWNCNGYALCAMTYLFNWFSECACAYGALLAILFISFAMVARPTSISCSRTNRIYLHYTLQITDCSTITYSFRPM